jgi:hypothetical protein
MGSCLSLRRGLLIGLALAVCASAPSTAQHGLHNLPLPTTGLRAELGRDIEAIEKKYLGLADVMQGKYGWRPGAGVRSVSEVFMHVAASNFMLLSMAGIKPPSEFPAASTMEEMVKVMQDLERITDPAEVRKLLQHSFTHAKHSLAMISDDRLDSTVKLFGRDATVRAALYMLATHMH